jgi:hypothetical protein
MKKLILFCFISLLIVSQLKAQDAVSFRIKYLPNHTYETSGSVGLNFNVNLNGNPQMQEQLKKQGITQPLAIVGNLDKSFSITTGAIKADQSFPLVINTKGGSVNLTVNGKPIPAPPKMGNDTKMYGHVDGDGHLEMDSIAGKPMMGKAMTDSNAKKASQMMANFQQMIKFPDRPMKIGDTFTQGMPINIPMGGNNTAIDVKITYKLTRIADGNAYFDLDEHIDLDLMVKKATVKVTGNGKGTMVYAMKDNFPSSNNNAIQMKIEAKMDAMQVSGSGSLTNENKTAIN